MADYSETPGKQYHLNLSKGDVGRYVIMPGDPKRCKTIAGFLERPKLIADSREYVTYTGYLGNEKVSVTASGAIRMEGTTKEYVPVEYPAVASFDVVQALVQAAEKGSQKYAVGVVQSKDSFYGQPQRSLLWEVI